MNKKFYHIVKSTRPVVVDFYADWCVPCRLIPPVLKELKQQYKTKIRIVKVNVDNYPDIANSCQVQNIPALVLFYDGKILWSGTGIHQMNDIACALKEIL